jgi:tRNA A-37 threonylcarbamoyl transferase component Bud32
MAAPNKKDDEILRAMFASGVNENQSADPEIGEAVAAYRKVEALFDILRLPAESLEASPADDLSIGKKLGEFEIVRPLASGGMGRIYLARQESLGRLVALKVCNPEVAREPRMKSRFVTEAHSLAKLAHPNIVPVVTTGEDQGYLFLAMEYVAGPNLAQVLQALQSAGTDSLASAVVQKVLACSEDENRTDPRNNGHARLDRAYQTWILQALRQVAQGLAAAHADGILHRDIKPANIVFAANGIPKIVDFGLARNSPTPSTTVAGEFYGTPAYTYQKGCEVPCDFQGRYSIKMEEIAWSYRYLAKLLAKMGRQADGVQALERGIARLESGSEVSADEQKDQALAYHISEMKGYLGELYANAGRREDARLLIDTELKKQPFRLIRIQPMVNLLSILGMRQDALEIGRLAEYQIHMSSLSRDRSSRQLAGGIVDDQLRQLGFSSELRERIKVKRSLGEELREHDYGWLGSSYQGTEGFDVFGQGLSKFPSGVGVRIDYMHKLAACGRKIEAWQAYKQSTDV